MITLNDKYCFVNESRGAEYKDVEFVVLTYGKSSVVRNTKTGGLLTFYNEHLYTTMEQRMRSMRERRETAQRIGVNIRHKRSKRRKG